MSAGGKVPTVHRSEAPLRERGGVQAALDIAQEDRRILEQLPDYILVYDRSATILYMNRAAPGFDRAAIVGTRAVDYLAPEDREPFLESLESVFRTGERYEIELTDSQGRPHVTRLVPIEREDGVQRVLSVSSDVTLLKSAQSSLEASERLFRMAFELAPVGKAIAALDGRYLRVNRAMCDLLGYSREELLHLSVADVTHPEDLAADLRLRDMLLRGEIPDFEVEKRHVRKDGEVIEVRTSGGLARNEAGEPLHFIGNILDVTEQKNTGRALRETEERYRLLFESVPVPVVTFDSGNLVVREINRAALDLFGYSRQEFLQKSIGDIALADDVAALRNTLLRADAAVRKIGVWRNRKKDGSTFYAEMSTHSCRLRGETFRVALIDDVTERLRVEQEKERLEEQLRQAHKMEAVGMLAGGVAHDFNNLLMPIMGYAEQAAEEADPDGPIGEYMDRIQAAAVQARDLVRQLLAFGRKQTLQMRVLELPREISQFGSIMRRVIPENIDVEVRTQVEVPAIQADPSQIQQILMNLVLNAQGAMPNGGKLRVGVDSVRLDASEAQPLGLSPGSFVRLTVSDTGHGIDPSVLPHIFEPFFTTRQRDRGTGLGLATVYGIVKQHRGAIQVHSEPDHGARFEILFPATDAIVPPVPEPECESASSAGGGETVLLVEDDTVVCALLRDALTVEGYTVLAASRPEDALRLAADAGESVRLLVSDVVLPGMNGRELQRQLETLIPGVRVLYISGYSGDVIGAQGVRDADVHMLEKPFAMHAFTGRVRQILDS